MLAAAPSRAQQRPLPRLQFYNWHGRVLFDTRFDNDSRESTNREDVTNEELIFGEEFRIGTDGWLYHPALLRFRGDVGIRFVQDFVRSQPRDRSIDRDQTQLNFDLHLGVLPDKPYPTTLFASQARSEVNSPLVPIRIIDTLRYGGSLQLRDLTIRDWKVPTRLSYRHQDTDIDTGIALRDNSRSQDQFQFVMDNRTERSRSRLLYDFNSVMSEFTQTQREISRHELRGFNDYQLDNGHLNSRVWITKDGGDFDSTAAALNENLRLIHSRALSSTYDYSFNYQEALGNTQLTHSAGAGLSHQFYESLTTSATANGSLLDSDAARLMRVGGGLASTYTKKIPSGRFGLRLAPFFSYQDENVEGGILTILDERHETVIGELIVLDQFLVRPDTIVVSDPVTLFVFAEGIDYEVVSLGVQTALLVIPGGDLDPEVFPSVPVISVRYERDNEPSRTFTTLSVATGSSLNLWRHVVLDVSYTQTNQDLLKGIEESSTLDDSTLLLGRLDLTFPNNRTHLEYENFESNITPRERYRVSHNLSFQPTGWMSLGLGAAFSHDEVTDTGRVSETFLVDGNATTWLTQSLLMRLRFLARQLEQEEQSTLTSGGSLIFAYRYGRLRFELENRLTWNRTDRKTGTEQRTEEVFTSVFFRVTRDF